MVSSNIASEGIFRLPQYYYRRKRLKVIFNLNSTIAWIDKYVKLYNISRSGIYIFCRNRILKVKNNVQLNKVRMKYRFFLYESRN